MSRALLFWLAGASLALEPSALAFAPELVAPLGACERHFDPSAGEQPFRFIGFGTVGAAWDQAWGGGQHFNQVRLDQAQAGGCVLFPAYGGAILEMEAIRSADPESLFGIAGDSLLIRLRSAFGFLQIDPGYGRLQLEAGLIPDPWLRSLGERYDLRAVSRLLAERAQLFPVSDLGAGLLYSFGEERFRARLTILNGEGLNQIEQNDGKDLSLILSADLLRLEFGGGPGTLALHAGYRDGSVGAGQGRNHRIVSGLSFDHPRLYLTVEHTEALGYERRPELHARALGVAANVAVLSPWLGLWGRVDVLDPDLDFEADQQLRWEAGLYGDLFTGAPSQPYRLRCYLGYRQDSFGAAAGPLPGAPQAAELQHLFISVEAAFLAGLSPEGP